jgi:hypothetical protein
MHTNFTIVHCTGTVLYDCFGIGIIGTKKLFQAYLS